VETLRDQLLAAATAGHGAGNALAKADPRAAAAALRELRAQGASILRLVTRAADGEVERVLGAARWARRCPATSPRGWDLT